MKKMELGQRLPTRRSGFVYEFKKNKSLFLMTLPAVLFFVIFAYLPMFGIIIAFKDINYSQGIFGSAWVGLKNFEFLVKTSDMFIITRNTVAYNSIFIVVGTFLAVLFAILLNEIKNKFAAKAYQTIMFLPYFISWVVVSYIVYAFLSPDYGYVNSIMKHFGMEGINWYMYPSYWKYIIVFLGLWKSVGYNSIVYLAAITSIDSEFYDAALIDGANKFQQAVYITVPCIKPIIIILSIMAVGKIFNADFGLFYQTTRDSGALYPTTQVIDTYVYRALKVTGDVGMAAAAGLYQSIIGFVLVMVTNTIVKKVDSDMALF